MPMLAAEMASVTAKPRMILARSRKVGSFDAIDVDLARSDIPTPTPVVFFQTSGIGRANDPIRC